MQIPNPDSSNDADRIVCKKLGVLGRTVEQMQERPIATSLGLGSIGAAIAFGGYNLRRYGTLLPPGAESSEIYGAAAAAVSTFFGR